MSLVLNICSHLTTCVIFFFRIMGICQCVASNHDIFLHQKLQIDFNSWSYSHLLLMTLWKDWIVKDAKAAFGSMTACEGQIASWL